MTALLSDCHPPGPRKARGAGQSSMESQFQMSDLGLDVVRPVASGDDVAGELLGSSSGATCAATSDSMTTLLELLRSDPPRATELLHREYAPVVSRIVSRLLGSDSEQQDLVQHVFLCALKHGHRVRDAERLPHWIRGVACNAVYEELRRRKRYRGAVRAVCAYAPNPENDLAIRDLLACARSAVDQLLPSQRRLFVLCHFEGHTLAHAAETCGYSFSTAKRRLAAARARIAKLTGNDPELLGLVDCVKRKRPRARRRFE